MDETDRNDAIKIIRQALKERSGKTWSVTGGRGTAWGWIEIQAPPARRVQPYDYTSEAECAELGELLGLDRPAHCQGVSIPASGAYRREYVARARGLEPPCYGQPYWD